MNKERLHNILLAPITTEKTTYIGEKWHQFGFKVLRDANKKEISEAVKLLFEVDVNDVQIVNVKGKRKRKGTTKAWKKAYVTLKEGSEIDFIKL